jgi:hypothetical protein
MPFKSRYKHRYRQIISPYYVYRHIRLDKNEPFYIGVGTNSNCMSRGGYYRGYATKSRSDIWKNIFNKTEIEVEILFETDCYEAALNKEIEFISLYKRKENGGSLCNLTMGGEGARGVKNRLSIKSLEGLRQRGFNKCGDKHSCAVLKERDVLKIIQMYNNGYLPIQICKQYPIVSKHTIYSILKKKNWKHLSCLINPDIQWTVKRIQEKLVSERHNISNIINEYKEGVAIYKIATKHKVDKYTIRRLLHENNIEIIHRATLHKKLNNKPNAISI